MTTFEERVRQARMASKNRHEMADILNYDNIEHVYDLLRRFKLPLFGEKRPPRTDAEKRRVIELYQAGKPQKEISATTNIPMGTVIGILQRAGVWRKRERQSIQIKQPRPEIRNRVAVIPVFKVDPFVPREADLNPLCLTLIDLKPGQCHYPYDAPDGKIVFCGHATDGKSYCLAHHAIAYQAPIARNREPRPR